VAAARLSEGTPELDPWLIAQVRGVDLSNKKERTRSEQRVFVAEVRGQDLPPPLAAFSTL
jgi:hypothetical protein